MASVDLFGAHFTKKHTVEKEKEEEDDGATQPTDEDICRVCRASASPGRPLFHPCLCTGSIKFIHQDCLVQWLRHSGKEYCELCKHQFQFAPIYRADMPSHLPLVDLFSGLMQGTFYNLRQWLHLSFVAFMWLIIVPVCIYRVYRFLLYGSLWSITSFPRELFSLENVLMDVFYGLVVVFLSLLGFISLVWLKDQVGNGRGPAWLEKDREELNQYNEEEEEVRMDLLQQYMDQERDRARARENAPERKAMDEELQGYFTETRETSKLFQALQHKAFLKYLNRLRIREMVLTYDLGMSHLRYQAVLKSAREKQWAGLKKWKEEFEKKKALGEVPSAAEWKAAEKEAAEKKADEIGYRDPYAMEELGDPDAVPPERGPSDPPFDNELGLTLDERELIALYSRPPLELSEEEREKKRKELEDVRTEMMEISSYHQRHQQMLARLLGHRSRDENQEINHISFEERKLVLKMRQLKKNIKDARRRERGIMQRQSEEARLHRLEREERMDRWHNRLLGWHQDDPLVLARRRGPEFLELQPPPRPNIGRALAGLAREQPAEPNAHGEEELTWARLLGLDGSFRFLEHVIWLICLNSVLIFTFVYSPYQLGWFTAEAISLWDWVTIVTWKGVVSIFLGYIVVVFLMLIFYYCTRMSKLPRLKNFLGTSYVALKVSMILAVEAGVFPLMCGWWIDICCLSLFGSTLKGRSASVQSAPGTVMFLHWLAGMIFVFYLASFVVLLREVLRPGVLWFLRNLNDQNFHPIQEMINLPFARHLRRFLMSCVMFGVCVMVVLLLPAKTITFLFRGFLPYNLSLTSSVSPIREVQLELVLLQFVIPTLLEHGHCRAGLKTVIQFWAHASAFIFGLGSYLLDKPQSGGVVVNIHEHELKRIPTGAQQDDPVHDGPAEVLGPGFAPFKAYLRPPYFHLRVIGFLIFTVVTATGFSVLLLTLPVFIGRRIMSIVGVTKAPEIYTAAIGLYVLWLVIRSTSTIVDYFTQGVKTLVQQFGIWSVQGVKCLVAGVLLFIVVPLLLGHLVDLLIITPLRVPSDRTPVFYPSTEWALGLLHTKCVCGAIWLTNMRFKRKLDQLYQGGIRNLNLTFVVREVAWPVILCLSLCIAVPYVIFMGLFPLTGLFSFQSCLFIYRYFFPSILTFIVVTTVIAFFTNQLKRLYNHIKNEKYLIGRQLVNYDDDDPRLLEESVQETVEQ